MRLRAATLDDIPAIARVHVHAWQTTYRGIFPAKVLQTLTYQKRENSWRRFFAEAPGADQFTYVAE
ncbi:MAG: GNAT family N-acetyltransferase, partial [Cyanobacteria bacterium P01_E01_bin.43]